MYTETETPDVDIVVPVRNEATTLIHAVRTLHRHLTATAAYRWRITIADNDSSDDTPILAADLADTLPYVNWIRLDLRGRGRALHAAWSGSDARIVAYMDADLSSDLHDLDALLAPLLAGDADLATGSRLAPGARTIRGVKREVVSRTYNGLLRAAFDTRVRDHQCGFKAITAEAAAALLPHVRDTHWFFDTELLLLAGRDGYRIAEVPIRWVEDTDSSVALVRTSVDDLRGMWRMWRVFRAERLATARYTSADAARARRHRGANAPSKAAITPRGDQSGHEPMRAAGAAGRRTGT